MHKYIVPASFPLLHHLRQSVRLPTLSKPITTTIMARTSMIKAAAAADGANQPKKDPEPVEPSTIWITEDKLAERFPCVTKDGRTSLPGFGPPVNYMPERDSWVVPYHVSKQTILNRLPNALQEWAPEPFTVRERNMMQMINAITDKPNWRSKVNDSTILDKWQAEAVTEEGQGFTENMFCYVSLPFLLPGAIQFADMESASMSSKIRLINTKRMTWLLYSTQSGPWSNQIASSLQN